ncbi:MAG: 16S rRNA (adenine(1518)-N(6)/adenine(1519)-N(6))-dimethyltransferase RsmA [bacterium]|nr:16S rRNA (adenine(1518)-N(6)/adenine(1519)-N(6))-dimethyltransferase RsmA [bacterium]
MADNIGLTSKIKNDLKKLGSKPKKSLGQNFLVAESAYKKIISALELRPDETVIEVGPGLGTLTEHLAKSKASVIAVEKDDVLSEFLKNKFSNQKNVTIINSDILSYKLSAISYKLVGNIPYYLTSHLIRTVLENWPTPNSIVLMLQKEVAQRIVAKPPHMSLLAVSVQYYAEAKIISYVKKESFWPAPKVDSAIVRLAPHTRTDWDRPGTDLFFKVVKAGFSAKRKQLGNNLSASLKISKTEAENKLNSADIDPQRRAETLTVEEWLGLTERFIV